MRFDFVGGSAHKGEKLFKSPGSFQRTLAKLNIQVVVFWSMVVNRMLLTCLKLRIALQ